MKTSEVKVVGLTVEEAEETVRLGERQMICCGDP